MKTLYAYSGPEEIGWIRYDSGEWSYEMTHYAPMFFERIETVFSRFVDDPVEVMGVGLPHTDDNLPGLINDNLRTRPMMVDDQMEYLAAKAETRGASSTEVIESEQ